MNAGESSTILPEIATGNAISAAETVTSKQEVDSKLDQAREQLLALRRQQDELERQKGELEELRRKQDEYARGKVEMIDNLTRGLTLVEREQIKSQRTAQVCAETITAFRDYLDQVQSLNEDSWTSATLRSELGRALGVIENSRLEYNRALTRLDCFNSPPEPLPTEQPAKESLVNWNEMLRYACLGAAASAPLILAGTIWVLVMLFAK